MPSSHTVLAWVSNELEALEPMRVIESRTGIRKMDLLSLFILSLLLLNAVGFGADDFCVLVGTLYPIKRTLSSFNRRSERQRMLGYWIVFAALGTMENILGDNLVIASPFYYAFKAGFLVWMVNPQKRGSIYFYNMVLVPIFKVHFSQQS